MDVLEEKPKAKIHMKSLRVTQPPPQKNAKLRAMMTYMDTGLKNSLSSMWDLLSKWIDSLQATARPELMTKGNTTLIQKRTPTTATDP